MPTRTRLPSCLAHSCSRVYLRSAGTFAIGSAFLDAAADGRASSRRERGLTWPRISTPSSVPTAACARRRRRRCAMYRSTDGPYEPDVTTPTARAVLHHRIAVARHRALGHLEPDQLAAHGPAARTRSMRLAADELALGGLHDPAEAGLERVRRVVDVVAVERVAHLEPQRVARAEADRAPRRRRGPRRAAPFHSSLGLVGRRRTARSRPRRCSRCARSAPATPATLPLREAVVADRRDVARRRAGRRAPRPSAPAPRSARCSSETLRQRAPRRRGLVTCAQSLSMLPALTVTM